MLKRTHLLMLIISVLLLLPKTSYGFQQRQERDSLRYVRDSLLDVIRMQDSLLLQASLDSLFLNNLITARENENDSLLSELRNMIFHEKLDSARQYALDSINKDFNRYARWGFRDSLYNIDEDSVRSSLNRLLGMVFHDNAQSPDRKILRKDMSRLLSHLANDSVSFSLVNGIYDTVPFVMKKNFRDSTSMFLVNARKDSVKIYLFSNGKSSIYLEADDDFRLSPMLKKDLPPDILKRDWTQISRIKIPKRKVLATRPTPWKTGARIDFSLSQYAFSHAARGGINKAIFLITSKGSANYKKGKVTWNNSYDYRYGILKMEGMRMYKNSEALIISNSFHHRAYKNYHYSVTSRFDSQFFPGFRNATDTIPLSKFLAPAIYSVGVGMTYKPSKELTITGDPLSGKLTFVADTASIQQQKHGIPEDQWMKMEVGTKVNIIYKKVLWKNVDITSNLGVFRSYVDNPMPDIDWRTDVNLKVFKYLITKFYLRLKYDDDVILPDYKYIDGVRTKVGSGKFIQVNQYFGISFVFHF